MLRKIISIVLALTLIAGSICVVSADQEPDPVQEPVQEQIPQEIPEEESEIPETVSVNVTIDWDDLEDSEKARDSYGIRLITNGVPNAEIKHSKDVQSYEWTDLPKYDADNALIEYKAEESTVPSGYTALVSRIVSDEGNVDITITNVYGKAEVTNGDVVSRYASLQAAENAVEADGTVKLLVDVKEHNITVTTVSHTIDLNGHTVNAELKGRVFKIGDSKNELGDVDITIQNGRIENAKTSGNGGGIYAASKSNAGGSLTIKDLIIDSCHAEETNKGGGGIYVNRVDLELDGKTTISNCTAHLYGGGVYAKNAYLHLTGSTDIDTCTATKQATAQDTELANGSHGGGVFVYDTEKDGSAYLVMDSVNVKVHGCTARLGGGISVESYNSGNSVSGGQIYNNTALTSGGGLLYNYTYSYKAGSNHSLELKNAVVFGNDTGTAAHPIGGGGGIQICSSAYVDFKGLGIAVFGNNAGQRGEDIYCRADDASLKSILGADMLGGGLNVWVYGKDPVEVTAGDYIPFDEIYDHIGKVVAKNAASEEDIKAAKAAATVWIYGNHAATRVLEKTGGDAYYAESENRQKMAGGGGIYSNDILKGVSEFSESASVTAELSKTYRVVKNWDKDPAEGTTVTVRLLKNGEPYSANAFLVLSAPTWTGEFTNLVYGENDIIDVSEDPVPGYVLSGRTDEEFEEITEDSAKSGHLLTLTNSPYVEDTFGGFSVKKVVDGTDAEKAAAKPFEFTVRLSDNKINTTETEKYGDMEFVNGVATFSLADGQSKTAENIPAGVTYTVTENARAYSSSNPDGISGTVTKDGAAEHVFKNTPKYGKMDPKGVKLFDGDEKEVSGAVFDFILEEIIEGEDPVYIETAHNNPNEFTYESIVYTSEDIGTHFYTIREEGTVPGIENDDVIYTIRVVVADNPESATELSVSCVIMDGEENIVEEVVFDNHIVETPVGGGGGDDNPGPGPSGGGDNPGDNPGGGNTPIDEPEVPLADLPDGDVPLGGGDGLDELPEDPIPLADAPFTGDVKTTLAIIGTLTAFVIAAFALQKKEEE